MRKMVLETKQKTKKNKNQMKIRIGKTSDCKSQRWGMERRRVFNARRCEWVGPLTYEWESYVYGVGDDDDEEEAPVTTTRNENKKDEQRGTSQNEHWHRR